MKRTQLIGILNSMGCEFVRHGGKHDWYRNPTTNVAQPVPRHREIKDRLATHIILSRCLVTLKLPRPSPIRPRNPSERCFAHRANLLASGVPVKSRVRQPVSDPG